MTTDLPPIEIEVHGTPQASIIWLHGLGADGHDFEMLLPELHWPENLPTRFIFPHAPVQAVTINGGMRMRAWYDIYSLEPGMREDESGIRASAQGIRDLIDHEIQRGIPPERILLAGFSQGGAIVLHSGMRYPQRLAGILALSTYLPLPHALATERSTAAQNTPVLMLHGTQDNVVPLSLAERSRQALNSAGIDLDWKNYPMGHTLCLDEIHDIRAWLTERLSVDIGQENE